MALRCGLALLLGTVLALLLFSSAGSETPNPPWLPQRLLHGPPYTCRELISFNDYAEWSHQWAAWNLPREGGWTREEELWIVGFYQQVRPIIVAGCSDAWPRPAVPTSPVDPEIPQL